MDGSGTIEISELKEAVRKCHKDMSDKDLERVIQEVDIQGTGIIHYHEFIAATFPVEKYATKERLHSLFAHFSGDKGDEEKLDSMTLREAFTKLGHNMSTQEIHEIMDEHDVDHNHELTFEEFEKMILENM